MLCSDDEKCHALMTAWYWQ